MYLRIPLQRQVQDIILGYSEPRLTFVYNKSADLCIGGKLHDKIINGFSFLERFFTDVIRLPTQLYLHWERKDCSVVVNFIYKSMKMKNRYGNCHKGNYIRFIFNY